MAQELKSEYRKLVRESVLNPSPEATNALRVFRVLAGLK